MNGQATFNKSKYILENLDRALSEGWVDVYFQPIIRTSNGRVCGEEALVRWDDPLLGMLNPMDFVPILEATNEAYKLDLYVLEKTLEKMNDQRDRGLFIVPTSVNISQVDFFSCDIVEEVTRRVEEANISKHMIAIAVSEGALALKNDMLLSQIEHFQDLGFQIWMDDYGSSNNALQLLQVIHFDALKINIFFVKQILTSESARIILTELVRMAISLHMDTIIEGVEFEEQADFLKEIGCTKLQGFHYCKPISVERIFERYTDGTAIGFENPEESGYYADLGRVNLYDLSFLRKEEESLNGYFDTIPLAIFETKDNIITVSRENKSFREFLKFNFGEASFHKEFDFNNAKGNVGIYTMSSIRKCGIDGVRRMIDDRLYDGREVQMLLHRIAVNPVTGVAAVVVAILSVAEKKSLSNDLNYNYIARTLAVDYIRLFYVNLDTEEYVEYHPDAENRDISVEENGSHFFDNCRTLFIKYVVEEDKEFMLNIFTKANIERDIQNKGSFTVTYRRKIDNKVIYVSIKAVRVKGAGNYIILGVIDVDSQMRQREVLEKNKEERVSYHRIMALSPDFISIYSVNPETEEYVRFNSSEVYDKLHLESKDNDFFEVTRKSAKKIAHPDDIKGFLKVFTKERVLRDIKEDGQFAYRYRILIDGIVTHVIVKAALIDEPDGKKLIVGVSNIERQVLQEQEYATTLLAAEDRATKDQLTGVKNKRAYVDEEDYLNVQIKAENISSFAIVVCDLNGLKEVNDTLGHHEGDAFIKEGCQIICDTFSRSPVFRIGGDEFAVIVMGKDLTHLDARLQKIAKMNRKNKKLGKVTIAYGAGIYSPEDKFVSDVFNRADSEMYRNKKKMKGTN